LTEEECTQDFRQKVCREEPSGNGEDNIISDKQDKKLGIEFLRLRVGKCGGPSENINEPSVSKKSKEFLDQVRDYWLTKQDCLCSCSLLVR